MLKYPADFSLFSLTLVHIDSDRQTDYITMNPPSPLSKRETTRGHLGSRVLGCLWVCVCVRMATRAAAAAAAAEAERQQQVKL